MPTSRAPEVVSPLTLTTGSEVRGRRILARLGEGAHAFVYRVSRPDGADEALKVLAVRDDALRRRMRSEGELLQRLDHPNVIRVHDVFEHDASPALLMEYVDGGTLEDWLSRTPDVPALLPVMLGIARGVEHAHAAGAVHRDLKPENILIHRTDDGVVPKIADFGLAKVLTSEGKRNTLVNSTLGTSGYMSPEQIRDAASVDLRSDLFSLGCLFYRMASGEPPFVSGNRMATMTATMEGRYTPLVERNAAVPPALSALIDTLLVSDREDRLQTAAELVARLEAIVRPDPPPARVADTSIGWRVLGWVAVFGLPLFAALIGGVVVVLTKAAR